ncbi:MAG: transcriptional regulator [Flavobacterium sp.]|nr:MAG: transcriptional regulator [Flavobacterium sp.]
MTNANKIICTYIYKTWIQKSKSQRAFAIEHNVEESIVRKIKKVALAGEDYNIPIVTLSKICEARDLKLSSFFKLVTL